jgi:hypothetical protein
MVGWHLGRGKARGLSPCRHADPNTVIAGRVLALFAIANSRAQARELGRAAAIRV